MTNHAMRRTLLTSGIPYVTHSWSPTRGCLGCEIADRCWAVRTCWRAAHNPNQKVAEQFAGLVEAECGCTYGCDYAPGCPERRLRWTGLARTYPEALDAPLHRRVPSVIFACPQGDLAHADEETVRRVFETMANPTRHEYLVLTKRPELLLGKLGVHRDGDDLFIRQFDGRPVWFGYHSHVWLGVSATDQRTYDERVSILCDPETGWPGNKWVSLEPEVEWVNLESHIASLSWVVEGSQSGRDRAPFDPDWAAATRDLCAEYGVPWWYKQTEGPECSGPDAWVCEGRTSCPEKQRDPDATCGFCQYEPWGNGSTIPAPYLDGRQHRAAPEPIAAILKGAGKPTCA